MNNDFRIGIVGLGYVGLPLCVELAKKHDFVVGYDINPQRIRELENFHDRTGEIDDVELVEIHNKFEGSIFTTDEYWLERCNVIIVTVPTPIDKHKKPDLKPLIEATNAISFAKRNNKGVLVIYESTVYPGCTEEVCVPILNRHGQELNKDYYVAYSPERINPGDKKNTLTSIRKVVSGSCLFAKDQAIRLYKSIGIPIHAAKNIKVAEMSKAIENAQRDLNISFANEVALFCNKLGIDTREVLEAAGTKWNFLPFKPGLVGGHCISVDPYYLIHKAEELDFHLSVIASGRRVNDYMPKHIASTMIKKMISYHLDMNKAKILIMGITFKENVPDLRNSKVIDVVKELQTYDIPVDVYDPHADIKLLQEKYEIDCYNDMQHRGVSTYSGIILAVGHDEFKDFYKHDLIEYKRNRCVVYDLKGFLPEQDVTMRL